MRVRHKQEIKDMQYQARQRVKAAKATQGKGQQAALANAKTLNVREEDEVIYRHRCELEALEESDPDAFERAQQEEEEAAVAAKEPPPEESKKGSGGGEGKKSKAQRRREKERAKEKEREERIALEKAGAGPSPRDVELRAINERLAAGIPGESPYGPVPPLAVHEVLSDGHCLYRSVDHQLTLRGQGPEGGFQALRVLCAATMRAAPDDFAPFLDLAPLCRAEDKEGGAEAKAAAAAFGRYCDRVCSSAEWGGHPELLALSKSLRVPIRVHAADPAEGTLVAGDWVRPPETPPLELSYHKHFYALGEHYNSTAPRRPP